jgi:hypothetical protein
MAAWLVVRILRLLRDSPDRQDIAVGGAASLVNGVSVAYMPHMCPDTDVPVFAAHLTPSGLWEVLAPVVRELSGRHGIRRIVRVSERPPNVHDHPPSFRGSGEGLL